MVKLKLLVVLVVVVALSGCMEDVIRDQDDIAFEYVVNNTDLYATGERTVSTNYTANDSAIQLFLIFHVVGNGASLAVDSNLSINGTVVSDMDYRTTAGVGIHEHFSMVTHVPKGSIYNVTNGTNIETIEWREYPILSGRNGTLSTTTGSGTGSQNLSQVLDQGNQSNQDINMSHNSLNWVNKVSHGANVFTQYHNLTNPNIYNYVYNSDGNYTETKQFYNMISFYLYNFTDGYHYAGFTPGNFYTNKPIESQVANGTAPFSILYSTTMNTNLNADLLDGVHADSKVNKIGDNMTGMLYINNLSVDKLMFNYVVPANTTWVNISGLNISRDGFYDVTAQLTCRNATNLKLYINDDINDANYTRQFVYADNAAMISARQNDAGVSACSAGYASTGKQRIILDAYGKTHYISEVGLNTGGVLIFFNGMYSYDRTITNVTTLNFKSDVENSIGYGSEIWIYRS